MRARWFLIALACATGCASEPTIACTTDDNCLFGQTCSTGVCRAAGTSTPMPDALTDDGSQLDDSGTSPIDAAPPSCTPTCSGTTPYCIDGACEQCRTGLDCPLLMPSCVDHACTL
jgi:hypothetical protein